MTSSGSSSNGAALAELARRQHGVVARHQLHDLGIQRGAIAWRVRVGSLHPVRRGVYAVGHRAMSREGAWLAAVLACGPGAALSHVEAAALWDLRPSNRALIAVTTPARTRTAPAGVELHRSRRVEAVDVVRRNAVPVTAVARTLVDLADALSAREVERLVERAEMLRCLNVTALEAAMTRANGRVGLGRLRAALGSACPPEPTRSALEEAFLVLCRSAGLPHPRVNARVEVASGAIEVDFLWPHHRLVAELDGEAVHRTRRAFEVDRRRDVDLMVAGHRVTRFTARRMATAPEEVVGALRSLLNESPGR